jgi:hypothetical protein
VRWLFVAVGAWLLGAAVSFARSNPPADPLAADARFALTLTLRVREQPLGEFLDGLRASEHLPVRADQSTRDERVTLFCRERRAAEILAAVARQFDYTWLPRARGDGVEYVLTQTSEQRRREEQLRAEEIASAWETLRQRLAERTAEGRLTPEERQRKRLERLRAALDRASDPEEREDLERSLAGWEQGRCYRGQPAYEIELLNGALAAMAAPDWNRFWEGQPFRFAYPAAPGRTAVPKKHSVAMTQTAIEWSSHRERPDGYYEPGRFAGLDVLRGEVWLAMKEGRPVLRFRCRYIGRQPGGRLLGTWQIEEDGHWLGTQPPEPGLHVDANDPELRRMVRIPPRRADESEDQSRLMVDLLELLAPAVPYALIADAYDPDVEANDPPRGGQRLDQWLRSWREWQGEEVRREGQVLHFRRRGWPGLRLRQVPDRVSRPWEAILRKEQVLPIRTLLDMAARLTNEQAQRLAVHWSLRLRLPEGYFDFLHGRVREDSMAALRLLSTLAPSERAQLGGGRPYLVGGRRGQLAIIEDWAAQFSSVGRGQFVRDDQPEAGSYLEVALVEDEQHGDLPTPLWLRLKSAPAHGYVGSSFWEDADLDEALASERETDASVKRADLHPWQGTRWTITLSLDPEGESPLRTASFLTRESAAARLRLP